MIDLRPFNQLPTEDYGWATVRRHFPVAGRDPGSGGWGCIRIWNDEEITPAMGFAMQRHENIEIVTYVREGIITHRDNLGNEGRIETGCVQVVSAGTGIRHAEYNLEPVPARIFRIWLQPNSPGTAPAWGTQPCPSATCAGCFVAIASGCDNDHEALPIRASARVLNAKLKLGGSVEYVPGSARLAYLVPSSGVIEINGIRIHARDGAAIKGADIVTIAAIEDADVVMVSIV